MIKPLLLGAASALMLLSSNIAFADHHGSAKAAIEKAVKNSDVRTARDMERDQFRNPTETLMFFGIKPNMTIAEVGPGSGWYTRILAPLVAEKGKYIALNGAPAQGERYERGMQWRESFIDRESGLFGTHAIARFLNQSVPFAAPNSVDAVLGIVQHRERPDSDNDATKNMRGYVKESLMIEMAEAAGFVLEAKSEINANPKDTAEWERGVWALQASSPIAEKSEQNQKIGESDRMTLKFVKPAA